VEKLKVVMVVFILVLTCLSSIFQVFAQSYNSEGNDSEWRMQGKYLNHSSWDKINFSEIYGLYSMNFSLGDGVSVTSSVVNGGFVYVGGDNGILFQLNASNLTQIISSYNASGSIRTSPIVVSGLVYVGSDDGYLYQLNASNISSQISNYSLGSQIAASPVIGAGFVYVGNNNGYLYQLNESNISQIISSYNLGGSMCASPAIAQDYIYAGGYNGTVYQLNASNISQLISNYSIEVGICSSFSVFNNFVYVGSENYNVYQLNASNVSELIAMFATGGVVQSSSAIADGFLYVGSDDGYLYQLNASNISEMISSFVAESAIYSSPALSAGFLYVGGTDGYLYQLNASNVSILFSKYYLDCAIYSSPAIAGNYIYLGGTNGYTYQISAINVSLENIDFASPNISFVYPTEQNNSIVTRESIFVNISAEDNKELSSIDIFVYNNESVLIFEESFSQSPAYKLFYNIPNGVYYVNATACDTSSNCINSETRVITISVNNYEEFMNSTWSKWRKNIYNSGWDETSFEVVPWLKNAYFITGDSIASSPAIVSGFVYVSSDDGFVYQLNASNVSEIISSYEIGSIIYSSPAINNGYLYVGSDDGAVYQLNATNISQAISSYQTGGDVSSSPTVADSFVYVCSDDHMMYQLNSTDISQVIATYELNAEITSSPAVIGGFVYIGSQNGILYQLNSSNISNLISSFITTNLIDSSPVVSKGYVYFGGQDGMMYQLDASNISVLISSYVVGSDISVAPAVFGNYVYIGAGDGVIYQFNSSDVSQLISMYATGESIYSSPAVNENFLYVGADDGLLYQLNSTNVSQLITTYETSGAIWSSPAISDEYVYVGSNDGILYQLSADNISLENPDFVFPNVQFELPTELSGGVLVATGINVNVSANCTDLANISIRLYNSSREIIYQNISSECIVYNYFSGLELGTYYFNATSCNIWGYCESTLTRTLTLIAPSAGSRHRSTEYVVNNICGDWSACSGSLQHRTCTLSGYSERSCTMPIIESHGHVTPKKEVVVNNTPKIPDQLFDINIDPLKATINAGDNLSTVVSLINLGVPGQVNASIYYEIRNSSGDIIDSENQIVSVETQEEFIKNFNTKNFGVGDYTIYADLKYDGQKEPALSQSVFSILEGDYSSFSSSFSTHDIILLAEILVLLLIVFFASHWFTRHLGHKHDGDVIIRNKKLEINTADVNNSENNGVNKGTKQEIIINVDKLRESKINELKKSDSTIIMSKDAKIVDAVSNKSNRISKSNGINADNKPK